MSEMGNSYYEKWVWGNGFDNNFSLNYYFGITAQLSKNASGIVQLSYSSLGTYFNYHYYKWDGGSSSELVMSKKWINLNTLFIELGLKFNI